MAEAAKRSRDLWKLRVCQEILSRFMACVRGQRESPGRILTPSRQLQLFKDEEGSTDAFDGTLPLI